MTMVTENVEMRIMPRRPSTTKSRRPSVTKNRGMSSEDSSMERTR